MPCSSQLIKIAVLSLALALLAGSAIAKLPQGYVPSPTESAWFKKLKQAGGGSCCSEQTDCRKLPGDQVRFRANHWEFLASVALFGINGDDSWHPIPAEKIHDDDIAAENPTGMWVVCFMIGLNTPDGQGVLCAVPPPGA